MIRIDEAILTAFGKFHNKHISFGEGLQIFYGANEAGKSTLQLFFRVMLYGVPNQRRSAGVVLRDRERMIPWGENYAEGALRLTVDDRQIEVYRRFGKTPAGDRTEVLDSLTGEPLPQYQGEDLGMQLFGIPAEVFEKTFWLRQNGAFPVGTDEELSRRLMNLKDTGEEDISADACIKALEQEKKSLRAKDKRGTPGHLDILYQKREEKVRERFVLLSEMEQRKSAQKRRDEASTRIKDAEEKAEELKLLEEKQKKLRAQEAVRSKWQEAKRLQDLIMQIKTGDTYVKFSKLTEETVNRAEVIKRKIETLDQTAQIGYDETACENQKNELEQRRKRDRRLFVLGIVVVLASLILGVTRIPFWQWILLIGGLGGSLLFGIGFIRYQQGMQRSVVFSREREKAEEEKKKLQDEIGVLEKELADCLEENGCKTVEELRKNLDLCRKATLEAESYARARETLLAGEDALEIQEKMENLSVLTKEDEELLLRDIGEEIRQNQKCQMDALSEMKELEGKLSYVYHGGRNPADAQAEIDLIDKDIAEHEATLKAVDFAFEVFQKVYEVRKSDFTPQVNERVNEFLDILMEGTNRKVRVSDTYHMKVTEQTQAASMEAEYFSMGTYEQIYFALRLALGSFVGNGTEPLFLDDFLVTFDDGRAKQAIKLLQDLGKRRQVLLFTCHNRVKEFGAELSANINDFKEEIKDGC